MQETPNFSTLYVMTTLTLPIDEEVDLSALSLAELIREFESDISVSDCHSLSSKVSRSHARREIQRRGISVLVDIGEHLETVVDKLPMDHDNRLGWSYLISGNQNNLAGKIILPTSPATNEDWFNWVRDLYRNCA